MQADIVWLRDDPAADTGPATAALPAEERAELAGFTDIRRIRSFVLSRCLLRQALAPHLRLPAHAIRFSRAGNGRLVLAGDSAWHFSLSHASGLVAVAMAESPCGVDIEVARNVDARRIAQRYFAASELALLDTLDGQARERAFFRLWTLKEAAVKALGEGLAGNLARLEFDLGGNPPALRDKRIALRFFQHVEDFFLAAAVAGNTAAQWRMREVSPAGLLHVSS